MKLIKFGLIRRLKEEKRNILKKFLMILGITVFVCFLFIFITFIIVIIDVDNERKIFIPDKDKTEKIVTFTPNSKIIKEEEIEFKYIGRPGIIEQKRVLSLVRKKFWRIYLKANRNIEEEFFDFDILGKYCIITFLKKTKIYRIALVFDVIPPHYYRIFIVGLKDYRIFDLENLSEFNELIREENIWIDTTSKALKYASLYVELVLNYAIEDYTIVPVNSLDEFVKRFILDEYNTEDIIPGRELVYYETLQQYIQYRPKKYQELLKYKDEIKSPQVIKETKYSYEIIMYACEILALEGYPPAPNYELALIKLKFTIYKNGEMDLKKKYLVRGIKQWWEHIE